MKPASGRFSAYLESKHKVRKSGSQVVCTISSAILVRSLVTRYGLPPKNGAGNARLPVVPADLHHHLARGLRDGAGRDDPGDMCWSGPAHLMAELQHLIQTATGLPAPRARLQGRRQTISWTAPEHVAVLKQWLLPNPEATPEGVDPSGPHPGRGSGISDTAI